MPVSSPRPRWGFALMELVLVIAAVALLAAIAWPVLASARKSARVTTCGANLRQIGHAYELYVDDYGRYPAPLALVRAPYVADRRILLCPEDTSVATLGAASSYAFDNRIPPDWRLLAEAPEVPPGVALVTCDHHLKRKTYFVGDDDTRQTAPEYPYYMVLRAGGAVERVDVSRVRTFRLPGKRPTFRNAYPGEPGYEEAEKR